MFALIGVLDVLLVMFSTASSTMRACARPIIGVRQIVRQFSWRAICLEDKH